MKAARGSGVGFVFLPGAGGDPAFWAPVAERLGDLGPTRVLGWPGAGDQPHDPAVQSFDDLTRHVLAAIDRPSVLVAQSLGGVVAVRLAATYPKSIRGLVLTATSGGVGPGVGDWQTTYRRAFPAAATWVTEPVPDQTDLPRGLDIETLLIWGDRDPISPVTIGARLHRLIARSELRVVTGGDHDLAREQPDVVAEMIKDFHRRLSAR